MSPRRSYVNKQGNADRLALQPSQARMSVPGPERQFAAAQYDACNLKYKRTVGVRPDA
jgi:hypothetical protein